VGDMARRAGALSPAREIPGPFRPAPRIVAGPHVRPGDEQDVRRLVRAAQRGDRDAMQALYVRYAPGVQVYVARIVPRQDAEDVTQEVFAKLLTELPRYRPGDAPFSAWILRVARNLAIDHLRRNRLVPCDEVRSRDTLADDSGHERAASLRLVLGNLTRGQRHVLVLSHLVGLTPLEIAEHLGLSVRSVHCLQHRGRCAARVALDDLGAAPATTRPLTRRAWPAVAQLEAA
jgi:RNA polymerase sigma-70 factor (ECF subfamily)